MQWFNEIRKNHGLVMLACCVAPLVFVFAAVYFFGLNRSYLYWLVLLLCPIMHLFMVRDMHKEHKDKKEKGSCH